MHRYLRYQARAGVDWIPQPLGIEETRGAIWQSPAKVPEEVICHNDFAPHNLAFDEGRLVGAIDFDMCSPGPRLWDLADMSREKSVELGKPELNRDAGLYEHDARFFTASTAEGGPWHSS